MCRGEQKEYGNPLYFLLNFAEKSNILKNKKRVLLGSSGSQVCTQIPSFTAIHNLPGSLSGTLWISWIRVIISFPILGKFSTIISSSIFSWSFFLSSSGIPMI